MNFKSYLILLLFLLLPSVVYPQIGVDINIEFGFGGTVKVGRWNPVSITVKTYSIPFKGRIEIEVKEGSVILENITSVILKSEVSLPAYSKGEYLFLVPLSDVRHPVRVSLFSQDGRLVKASNYEMKELDMRLPIMCIVDNWTLPYRGVGTRILSLESEKFLNKPVFILDPFDAISLSPLSLYRLKGLLDKWTVLGGKVITDPSIDTGRGREDTYPGDIDISPLVSDLIKEEDVPLPSKIFISLFLFLYLVILFISLYYFRGHFLKKTAIYLVICFIFSYLAFTLTSRVKEFSDTGIQINLLKIDKNLPYARFYSGIALFSPYNKTVKLSYNSRDLVFWISRRERGIAQTTIITERDKNLVEINLGPNKLGLLRGWGVLDFDIRAYRDRDIIKVINNSRYTLQDAYLLKSKGYLSLGDIKIGSNEFIEKDLSLSRLTREDIKGKILSWFIDNGIILLGDKNYISGWIYTIPSDIRFESGNIKSITLCLLEI